MDIISSINSAFTQVQRSQTMSMSSGEGDSLSRIGYRQRESTSHSSGPIQGGQGHSNGNNALPAVDSLRSAVQNAVAYDRSESGGLQLRTQEGDIVRIKFMNSESFNAQNQQFDNGGTMISDFSLSGSNDSRFKVVVDGDLNGAELSAVRDVLIQAREIANTFYDGDVKEAFGIASDFNYNSEQLANVNMRFSVRETFTYNRTALESQSVSPAATNPPAQLTQPVSPVVDSAPTVTPVNVQTQAANLAAQVSQPDAAAPAASSVQATALTQEAPFVPETPVHAAPDPAESLAAALSTITNFLSQLTESLNSVGNQFQNPTTQSPFTFSGGFQLQMVSALVSQIEPFSAEKPLAGQALAAATINELAMKMDARVDDVA